MLAHQKEKERIIMEIAKQEHNVQESSVSDNPLQKVRYEISSETKRIIQSNFSLIERLITKKSEYKLALEQRLKEAKTEFDLRHSMHLLASELQLQALKSKYEAWLSMIKIRCSRQVTEFAQSEYYKLVGTLEYHSKQFDQMINAAHKECENNKESITYKRRLQSIQKQIDAFYDMHDKHIDTFKAALEAKLITELTMP